MFRSVANYIIATLKYFLSPFIGGVYFNLESSRGKGRISNCIKYQKTGTYSVF